MALALAKPKRRSFMNPSLIHLLSSSSSSSSSSPNVQNDPNSNNNDSAQQQSQPSFSSYFSDVKASLRQQQQQQQQTPNQYFRRQSPQQQSPVFNKPTNIASLEEIRKNLSEFRRRSSVPSPTEPNAATSYSPAQQHISFQELYKRNLIAKSGDAAGGTKSGPQKPSGKLSFEAIRESLRQMRPITPGKTERRGGDRIPLDAFSKSLRLKPKDDNAGSAGPTVIGGTGGLPFSVFGKEMKEDREGKDAEAMKTEFVKMYSHGELGEKLRNLRPENGVKEFSLHDLNERLAKLREIEEKEAASRVAGVSFKDLRESLARLKMADDEKTKRTKSE